MSVADLNVPADRIGYAQAIGIEAALNQRDQYPYGRHGRGKRYSPLVAFDAPQHVDEATAEVSGCIRSQFPDACLRPFVRDLTDVIGDLHDNVWSHGESTGISQALSWNKSGGRYIEFGLADCGRGFLGELTRSGITRREGVADDSSAIRWCIQEGHSSKMREEDPWAQRLPEDAMGNPMGVPARIGAFGNHHQGLGLFKLTSLVARYGGELWLASGESMLVVDAAGSASYIHLGTPWNGVALACRFATDRALQAANDAPRDELDDELLRLLGGPSNDDSHHLQ